MALTGPRVNFLDELVVLKLINHKANSVLLGPLNFKAFLA